MPSAPAASLHVPVPRRRNPADRILAALTLIAAVAAVAACGTSGTVAALVNLNAFPTSADPVQLQRVADLMQMGGMLAKPLNVAPLVSR